MAEREYTFDNYKKKIAAALEKAHKVNKKRHLES